MKITRAGLRGMVAEALQEMSMYGGEEEEEMFEARRPLSPGFHAAKRRMGGYPSLSAEELEGAEMPTMPLTHAVGGVSLWVTWTGMTSPPTAWTRWVRRS